MSPQFILSPKGLATCITGEDIIRVSYVMFALDGNSFRGVECFGCSRLELNVLHIDPALFVVLGPLMFLQQFVVVELFATLRTHHRIGLAILNGCVVFFDVRRGSAFAVEDDTANWTRNVVMMFVEMSVEIDFPEILPQTYLTFPAEWFHYHFVCLFILESDMAIQVPQHV